jgi:hypothetical protein
MVASECQVVGWLVGKPQFFPSLDGISQLFSRSITAASLWVHLVCINLFTARHVFLDGKQPSLSPNTYLIQFSIPMFYDSPTSSEMH